MKTHGINIPALVLSMHDELLYAERSLRAGAKGYISNGKRMARGEIGEPFSMRSGDVITVGQRLS